MTARTTFAPAPRRRILFTAVGSLGDLHPYLALAQELQRRGHTAVLAGMPNVQERVEALGIDFRPLRAATVEEPSSALMQKVFNGGRGMEYIVRELILPNLRQAYEDTCAAAAGVDLVVTHPLTFASRFVAETRGLPWVSTQLAPFGLLSALDPPALPGLAGLRRVPVVPALWRALYRLADRQSRRWMKPVDALRIQLGLPDRGNPLFAGGHSPTLELALFSPLLGQPQADWPRVTEITGFPFLDQNQPLDPALADWLHAGSPPIVFTLGSSAVWDPGAFFEQSAAAARRLGRRALLLGSRLQGIRSAGGGGVAVEPDGAVLHAGYGPYTAIFPHSAAIVHQGGVGTTAEALRSGRPFLVVPFGADQPDNAARCVRLGVARTLSRRRYKARRVATELDALLRLPRYSEAARNAGAQIRAERGADTACDALEALLAGQRAIARPGTPAMA